MNFGQAIKTVFSKYAVFEGRATRSEYWWWYLFVSLVNIVLAIIVMTAVTGVVGIDRLMYDPYYFIVGAGGFLFLAAGVYLALFIPTLAVFIRRLRDTGRKAWYLLLLLVPYAGQITIFVITLFPSKKDEEVAA